MTTEQNKPESQDVTIARLENHIASDKQTIRALKSQLDESNALVMEAVKMAKFYESGFAPKRAFKHLQPTSLLLDDCGNRAKRFLARTQPKEQ